MGRTLMRSMAARLVFILPLALSPCMHAEERIGTDTAALARGNTQFAIDLYSKLRNDKALAGKNLFFSPYSISAALAMTYAGARGETAHEMATALRLPTSRGRPGPAKAASDLALPWPPARLRNAFGSIDREMHPDPVKDRYEIHLANALWPSTSANLRKPFLDLCAGGFGAAVRQVDFGHAEEAASAINKWVRDQTRRRIQGLVQPDDVDGATMVLTNAIYFKGLWAAPFQARKTGFKPFLVGHRRLPQVQMMTQTDTFLYAEVDNVQVLELPYGGGHLGMVVLLPRRRIPLPALEVQLKPKLLERCIESLNPRAVKVFFPRFAVRCRFSVRPGLAQLGIKKAFEPGADFSGIGDVGWLKDVIHKAFVKVSEEGTEAGGATAVVVTQGEPPKPAHFTADHPFMFVIRERRTGTLLFMGRVVDPSARDS